MLSTPVIVLGLAPVLLFTLWFISSTLTPPPVPESLQGKRIILLIAHPDDESMFFSPALQALADPAARNHLKVLCLSTGDAEGLGQTRRKELETAALTLGVRRREDVFVMDDPRFRDGMKEEWEPKEVARVLAQAFAPQLINSAPNRPSAAAAVPSKQKSSSPSPPPSSRRSSSKEKEKKEKEREREKRTKSSSSSLSKTSASSSSRSSTSKSSSSSSSSSSRPTTTRSSTKSPRSSQSQLQPLPEEGPRATIDVLLTFDSKGISSHPNHIALHHASILFLRQIMHGHTGYTCPVDLYTLTTVNLLRKYTFILDLLPTYLFGVLSQFWQTLTGQTKKIKLQGRNPRDNQAVFISGVRDYFKARRAMVSGHKSQMVWFRWGWISAGRYMVINDLRRAVVPGI